MSKPIFKDAYWAVFVPLLIGMWCGYSLMLAYPIGTPVETFHLRKLFTMLLKKDIAFKEALQEQGATLEDVKCGYIPVNRFGIEIYITGEPDVLEIQQKLRKIIFQDMNSYFLPKYQYTVDIYTCAKITNDSALDAAEAQYLPEYNKPVGRIQYSASLARRLLIYLKQLRFELGVLFVVFVAFCLANKFLLRKKELSSFLKRHVLLCLIALNIGIAIGINVYYKCGIIRSPEADSIQKLICFLINNDETVQAALQAYEAKIISVSSSFSPRNKFIFIIHVTECMNKFIILATIHSALQNNIDYFFLHRYELFFEIDAVLSKNSSAAQVPIFEKVRNDFGRKFHRTESSANGGFGVDCATLPAAQVPIP